MTGTKKEILKVAIPCFSLNLAKVSLFASVVISVSISVSPVVNAGKTDRLAAVLENLRQNEKLYKNLETKWQESYRKDYYRSFDRKNVPQSEESRGWSVEQDGLFFLNLEGQSLGAPDKAEVSKLHLKRAFDSRLTRLLELRHNYVGNIINGPSFDRGLFHPHTLPLRFRHIGVSLATYMSGRESILADPRGGAADVPEGLDPTIASEEIDEVNGLKCHKVVLEHRRKNKDESTVSASRIFWLAKDRNYLPVKTVSYNFFYSRELPIEVCILSDLREIKQGIWFPFKSKMTVYEGLDLLEKKEVNVSWTKQIVVEEVSLEPKHNLAFFQDVQFPDGTPVYEIADGKIMKSYVIGDKPILATAPVTVHAPGCGF